MIRFLVCADGDEGKRYYKNAGPGYSFVPEPRYATQFFTRIAAESLMDARALHGCFIIEHDFQD